MVMDPTLPRIKVRDLLMQAFLTGWERSDKSTSQDEYLQSSIQVIEIGEQGFQVVVRGYFGTRGGLVAKSLESNSREQILIHSATNARFRRRILKEGSRHVFDIKPPI